MEKLITDFKINTCPYCGTNLIYADASKNIDDKIVNTKSEEHIIPKSLGNDDLILPKGIICDKCNNYFSTNIEKQFLSLESISLLRSYHLIPSRKNKVPSQDVLFCGDIAKLEYDMHINAMFLGISPQTVAKLYSGARPTMIFSKEISVNELKNNYVVSRMLIKIFTEMTLYYTLLSIQQDNTDKEIDFVMDKTIKEFFDYTRYGKPNKIYNYEVNLTRPILPYSGGDFVSSITFTFKDGRYHTMILNLSELQFVLTI